MPIIGYCDRFSVQPGETVRFMVSSEHPKYRADLVRLIHGSADPRGPGFKAAHIMSAIEGDYPGKSQTLPKGSYVILPPNQAMASLKDFTVQLWFFPTMPGRHEQGILALGRGVELLLDEEGRPTLTLRDGEGHQESIRGGKPVLPNYWYFIACSYDSGRRVAALHADPATNWSGEILDQTVIGTMALGRSRPDDGSSLIGALWSAQGSGSSTSASHFNGKIDSPRVFSRALSDEEIKSLRDEMDPLRFPEDVVASWDFSQKMETSRVVDLSPNQVHGDTVNSPKRAVTGRNWTGNEQDFKRASHEYRAIHFHDDDLDDCRWDLAFELTIPADMKSGTYATRLQAGDDTDYIPFFVRPLRHGPTAKIAFLAPTLSYMAYGNDHSIGNPELMKIIGPSFAYPVHRFDRYLVKTNLLSLYDRHTDGSGVCYVSRLRPILTMRPDYREPPLSSGKGAPHQFSADLCLLDWLEAKGFAYDVITDEDLHYEGSSLLAPYRVVLTGTHPEYWTGEMLKSMENYLNGGGRLMYMGGNGFYWVTSINPTNGNIFEVRRWGGTQSWTSQPGEFYHSSTGELGGLWRNRNRSPQKMLGVGFTSQGFDRNTPYRRLSDSHNPKVDFIFEGVRDDELIGDFDSLILEHGAGGYEVDRLDFSLGTPPHALLLATATGFSDSYQHVIEENGMSDANQGGTVDPLVRADMVYLGYPKGGAVFSVGSISWCGALFYNGYENNVSRVTENVLRRFASPE